MPSPSSPEAARLAERREFVRGSVLRANRAIAIILALVVLLGIVLTFMIVEARRNQGRAERAEEAATERLWKASLAQARAENVSTKAGHRAAALEAVQQASRIRASSELRNVGLAALSQRDLVPERQWPLQANAYGYIFDPHLKYYATRYSPTALSLYRLEDNTHVRDFPMPLFSLRGSNIGDFTFSATGRYMIIRYNGGGMAQWEVETGKLVRVLNADSRMQRWSWPVSFSADDRLMGCHMRGTAGTQFIYDLEKGEVRELPRHPPELAYSGGQNITRLSPEGTGIAAFSGDAVFIFDALTGEELHRARGTSNVQMIHWSHRGDRLAYSCDDQNIFIWEPRSGRTVQLGGQALLPWKQQFSPDDRLFATGGQDGVTRLWDVDSASLLVEIPGVQGPVISSDGTRMACASAGKWVGVWRIEQPAATKLHQGRWRARSTVWQCDLSADGRTALWAPPGWTGSNGWEIFDLESGKSVSLEKQERVLAGLRPGHAEFWTTGTGDLKLFPLPVDGQPPPAEPLRTVPLPKGFPGANVSFSADGSRFVVAGPDRRTAVMDLNAPEQPVMLEPAFIRVDGSTMGPASPTGGGVLALSPDGSYVAAGYNVDGGRPVIWDARSGRIIHRLPAGMGFVTWSPDGKYLALTALNHVHLFSTADWKLVWTRERDSDLAYYGNAAFTGDSSLVACSMGTRRLVLYNIAGENLAELDFRQLKFIANTRFSADGSKLVVSGMEGRIAEVDLGLLRRHLREMNLDWPMTAAAVSVAAAPSVLLPALLGLVPVGIAAVLGALVLLRQRRLTHEFVDATELAARRAQELAAEREVSELKSRFVTTVSHEFRTPLGITMSAVELLRHYEDRLPADEKKQLFDDIHSATRNMASLMEQVLVLGRVDAGKLAYKPAPLDMEQLARKLTDESLSATNRKCTIEWTAENDLSGACADEGLLRHIFINLLSNGVKYSPDGSVVHFSARREGPMAVFTVKDSGIGIPEADLPKLFEAFHRGSNVGDIPGTGLGLVIIKRCAELHRGSIQVKSKPGEGTTFTIRVPAWD